MTREEVSKQILSLEENESYHPGAKGLMAGDKAEFSEEQDEVAEKKGPSLEEGPKGSPIKRGITSVKGRKHVGRGGMKAPY